MRITNNMLVSNMMRHMNNNLKRMDKVQQQMASGKKFQLPSDDPIGVSRSLKLHTDLSRIEQFRRNADDATSWLEITEDALSIVGDVLHRAKELSGQAASGTNADEDLQKISAEIGQLREHLIKTSNSTYAGRSIFTGFKTDSDLLDSNGNYIIDLQQDEVSKYNVGVSEDIEVNTIGVKVFGLAGGDYASDVTSGDESKLIKLFTDLHKAMGGNPDGTNPTGDVDRAIISSNLGELDDSLENILSVRAQIGAKVNRLEMVQNKLSAQEVNFTELLSNNEDVDMSEVIMNLKMEENVYRASLSAGAKIIQPTLVDFLR